MAMKKVARRKSSGGSSMPGFKAWSYSRLTDYEKCPAFAKYKYLDKLDEGPKGPALLRGGEIHKDAEEYLKGEKRTLPETLKYFKSEFSDLKKKKAVAEGQWAFNAGLNPVEWFSPSTWVRMIVDAQVSNTKSARVIDFKTGKLWPHHEDQLSLYAMGGFSAFTGVKKIKTELWYLDYGEMKSSEYELVDAPELLKYWQKRSKPMLEDTKYPTTPSQNSCRWCNFKASKGGPCKKEYRG
jgi:hypothetical protein